MGNGRRVLEMQVNRFKIEEIDIGKLSDTTCDIITNYSITISNLDKHILKQLIKGLSRINDPYIKQIYDEHSNRYSHSLLRQEKRVVVRIEQEVGSIIRDITRGEEVMPSLKRVGQIYMGRNLVEAFRGMQILRVMAGYTIGFLSAEQKELFDTGASTYEVADSASMELLDIIMRHPSLMVHTHETFIEQLKYIAVKMSPKNLKAFLKKAQMIGLDKNNPDYQHALFANWLLLSLEADEIYDKKDIVDNKGKLKKLEQIRETYGYNSREYEAYYLTLNKKAMRKKAVEARAKYKYLTPDRVSDEWLASRTDLQLADANYKIKTGQLYFVEE